MASRGRSHQNHDWDEVYNSNTFDHDDSASGGNQLDHTRLYITNIPKALNDEGLRSAFSKFGTLHEVFVSRDPKKKYGLVKYETPGEAKLAMMKMNKTEPLRFNVAIAHKKRGPEGSTTPLDRRSTRDRPHRDDNASVSSRGKYASERVQEEFTNGDEAEMTEEVEFDAMDPNLHLELENLKLEQLRVQEEQLKCKHRITLLKQSDRVMLPQNSSRQILPNGQIIVRNVNKSEARDDGHAGAGAGDSPNLPGLQRVQCRLCVSCGLEADLFCSRCGVTPYCTLKCQRRDWTDRHRHVCHNLARLAAGENSNELSDGASAPLPAAPLRKPRPRNSRGEQSRGDDSGSEKKTFPASDNRIRAVDPRGGLKGHAYHQRTYHDRERGANSRDGDLRQARQQDNDGRQPGNFDGRQPGNFDGRQPGNFDERQPGNFDGRQPGSLDGRQPGNFDGRQPGNFDGRQPDNFDGRQPGTLDGRQPGSIDGRQPGSFDLRQPGNFDRLQPGSFDRRQPGNFDRRQPGNLNGHQGGNYDGSQPGNLDGRHPGNLDGRQPGNLDGRQPGNFDGRQPGNLDGRQPGNFDGRQPGNFDGHQLGSFDRRQPGNFEGLQPGNFNLRQAGNCDGRQPGNFDVGQAGNFDGRQAAKLNGLQAGKCAGKPRKLHVTLTQDDDEDWGVPSKKPPPEFSQPRQEARKTPVTPQAAEPLKQTPATSRSAEAANAMAALPSPPGSISAEKLVPTSYLIENLAIGDVAILSVDAKGSDCRTKDGFVCLSIHEKFTSEYDRLCNEFIEKCQTLPDGYAVSPGDTFSYLNPEDGGWYRARSLTATTAALLDSSRVVTAVTKRTALPPQFADVPEFCCHLQAEGVELGNQLKCTLLSKTIDGYKVSLENIETNTTMQGAVSRWLPEVEYPIPKPIAAPSNVIPRVSRRALSSGALVLLAAALPPRLALRPADTRTAQLFEAVLHDVAHYGLTAKPLSTPPQKGALLIVRDFAGQHHRALCQRTNIKMNKYLMEYVEFGNIEIAKLEDLYPCPEHLSLSVVPAQTSLVAVFKDDIIETFTASATQYLEDLRETAAVLIVGLPAGAESAPSGSYATLTMQKNNQLLESKLKELCLPEWKKWEDAGGDVVSSTERLMYCDLSFVDLPASGCTVEVQDISGLIDGTVYGYERGLPHAYTVFTELTEQLNKYCETSKEKLYVPIKEELCIAHCPPYAQWLRGVVLESSGSCVHVCYVDHGNAAQVPATLVRRMLPQFVRGLPAVAHHLNVRGFPENPTQEQIARAIRFMKVDDEGRGVLEITRCDKIEDGYYDVDAPALIAAIEG